MTVGLAQQPDYSTHEYSAARVLTCTHFLLSTTHHLPRVPTVRLEAIEIRENGMELFAAFAGLAPARGGQAVALAWKGLRPDAGCSMRSRARRGGGLSAAAAAVGTLSCCRPVPASGCRYRAAAGDVVSAACGRGSGRVDVVV